MAAIANLTKPSEYIASEKPEFHPFTLVSDSSRLEGKGEITE